MTTEIFSAARLFVGVALRAFLPRVPPYLIFFVTHRCQACCPFCFDRVNRETETDQGPELSAAEVERIAAQWRGLVQVTLTGGEPFLRDDLFELALAFRKAGAKSLTLDTNGLLTERIVKVVTKLFESWPGLYLDLNLSIDGPAEVHDRLRGVAGAYEKVMATAEALVPQQEKYPGFRLGATVTVSKFNEQTAEETVRELMANGKFQRVQALWVRGKPFEPAALEADLAVYEKCAAVLGSEKGKKSKKGEKGEKSVKGIRQALSRAVRETVMRTVKEKHLIRPCLAGRTMVTLDPQGRVYPCEMLPQFLPEGARESGIADWIMGSLRDEKYSIRQVLSQTPAARIQNWVRDRECFCSFECAAYNNLVFSPREWPGLLKRIF